MPAHHFIISHHPPTRVSLDLPKVHGQETLSWSPSPTHPTLLNLVPNYDLPLVHGQETLSWSPSPTHPHYSALYLTTSPKFRERVFLSPQNFDQPSYDSLGHQFVRDLLHNDLPLIARPVSNSLHYSDLLLI